ncbi:hypothetical protein BDK51DRAFT_41190 [Blyttiomyces helicus]|uniref:Uncharacterized protein n=1 Tax=Blyttiomyces helicus TaxID=388810 RepID=A0A4P9W7A7_9FUNG|nr:hypothetical protein BDK51DRAFT_41190 [Blyttiomyces helicus]|eukprot:RKO88341.1 hypothetical protein BDK51DRAFT_41190 [Blyttiomyces helicus]
MASFWGTILPFLVAIPLQTGAWVTEFYSHPFLLKPFNLGHTPVLVISAANWSSLIFQSLCNFVAPFMVYLFLSKRNLGLAGKSLPWFLPSFSQPKKLEFLDLEGGSKKVRAEDEDDYDYVYHLPYAELGPRRMDWHLIFETRQGSISNLAQQHSIGASQFGGSQGFNVGYAPSMMGGLGASSTNLSRKGGSMLFKRRTSTGGDSAESSANGVRARALRRQMLGPHFNASTANSQAQSRRESSVRQSHASGSGIMLSVPGAPPQPMEPGTHTRRGSFNGLPGNMNRVHPISDLEDVEAASKSEDAEGRTVEEIENDNKAPSFIIDETGELGNFRALPLWVTKRIPAFWVALFAFLAMVAATLVVVITVITEDAQGNDPYAASNANAASRGNGTT